jgi:NADH-quinone oxidoreductase subunit G
MNKGAGLYFHPVGDTLVPTFGKNIEMFKHKVGLEEIALLLIIDLFSDHDKLPNSVKEQLDRAKLVDLLGGDSGKFEASFTKMMKKKESFSLIIGEDLYFHEKAENIAKLIAVLENSSEVKVAMVPPKTNSLGVALICDLDDEADGFTIGYNASGDFRLSALGDGDLDIPAMNQQEGTLTNMHKRVTPTNAALEYLGYELNDIMREVLSAPTHTIDWTLQLPVDKGFRAVEFDSLPNGYKNNGTENRGYLLNTTKIEVEDIKVDKFDNSILLDGEIAYRCNPQRQFNDFTDKAHQIFEEFALYASPAKAKTLGKRVVVEFDNGNLELDVIVDDRMEGDIVAIPDFKSAENIYELFGASRYQKVIIREV